MGLLYHDVTLGSEHTRFFDVFEALLKNPEEMKKDFDLQDQLDYEVKLSKKFHRPGKAH
jgi:hypothetical protein